eukprot:6182523-Pleurochrysis_carterae.AAC.4
MQAGRGKGVPKDSHVSKQTECSKRAGHITRQSTRPHPRGTRARIGKRSDRKAIPITVTIECKIRVACRTKASTLTQNVA